MRRATDRLLLTEGGLFVLGLLLLWLLVAGFSELRAATFSVDSTLDEVDITPGNGVCATAGGACTLRAAVQEANALAGADTIDLPAGTYTITRSGKDQTAVNGDLDIFDDLTIVGAGAQTTIIDGGALDRVFDVLVGASVASLSGVTVRNGYDTADGGGILHRGNLLELTDVSVVDNTAEKSGGGLAIVGSASATINGVTFSGNSAVKDGGGIQATGTLTATNVTVSGNAAERGGGIAYRSSATLTNVTVTLNSATLSGGNVQALDDVMTLLNTIVSGSLAGGDCAFEALGSLVSAGNNIDSDNSCGLGLPSDTPPDFPGVDPKLGPLQDNGGPTQTHALLAGSPALDMGANTGCPSTDQRGMGRPFNDTCDIGAYEESNFDVVIDDDFSEWDDGVGNEYCVDDQGGADDWTNPSILDITKFCIASNQSDEVYLLFGFDEVTLSGQKSTACVLVDTDDPENFDIDRVVCVTLAGSGSTQVDAVELFSCDDTLSDGCGSASLMKSYGASDYGFSNTEAGPFDAADSLVELRLPYADLGITGGQIVFSSLVSYPGNSPQNLTAPKDSIFGASGQDYETRINYDLDSGAGATVPVTLASFHARGRGSVVFEWSTATEAGNLGFHLYELVESGFRRLNAELIPSRFGDALEPQRYVVSASGVEGETFLLEDVDLFGVSRYHGPFALGERYGRVAEAGPAIDWSSIRRAQAVAKVRRGAARAVGLGKALGASWGRGPGRVPGVRLLVSEDGLYRVSYESLLAAGFDLAGVPAAQLALSERGKPVPIRVGGRGLFGPGSYVEFVGRGIDSLYTRQNVYVLEAAPVAALRVGEDARGVPPSARVPDWYVERRTVEQDRAYHFAAPGEDPWYDTRLLAISEPVEMSFALPLDERVADTQAVELELELWGVTDFPQAPDHHVVVEVNGVELASEWFDGLVEHPIRVEVPEWLLSADGDWVRVVLPHDTGAAYDLVHYDRYRVSYGRGFVARDGRLRFRAQAAAFQVEGLPSSEVVVYRVTGGRVERLTQVQVTGVPGSYRARFAGSEKSATYWVATVESLGVAGVEAAPVRQELVQGEAKLLVVSHADFLEGLEPWLATRRAQGWSVQVVDVAKVYASFGYGLVDPWAIRELVRRAYREMGTESVLLVGGDTYDYHDVLGLGSISFVPTLYARTDAIVHFAPVDALYGDVDADGVPEVAVGRWPVRTTAELASVIDKTLSYAGLGAAGTAVLAADAYDVASGTSFRAASESMRSLLPATWQVERAYLDDLGLPAARQLLLDEINAGVALTSYFGHSGPTLWSFQRLFHASDAATLTNAGRPTVVTQWGCWNTYHVAPRYDTLGHRLLLSGDRGAAAVLGAATLTEASSELELGQRLFARLAVPGQSLGQAVLEAKQDLANTQPHRLDVLLGWTLLGDPTLTLQP